LIFSMKIASKAFLTFILISSFFFTGCENTDLGMATQAVIEAVQAVTLDEEKVKRLSV